MTDLGLCISPGYIPEKAETEALGVPFYRSILYSLRDLEKLKATKRPLLITLNNECAEVGFGWTGWAYAVKEIKDYLGKQLLLLECGNELDLFWQHNNVDVPPKFAAELVKEAASIIPGKVSATSVAGAQWQDYMQQLVPLCQGKATYFNIHPYGQRPKEWNQQGWGHGDLVNAIKRMHELGANKVICSEIGVKIGDAGNELEVATFMQHAYTTLLELGVAYAGWFAWIDMVGAPHERGQHAFGLRDTNGNTRPAWHAYQNINAGRGEDIPLVEEVKDMPNLDRWRSTVGSGILKMMEEDNTEPAMASEWRPFNRPANMVATVEECIGVNGVTYRWILSNVNKGFRFPPD